MTLHGENAIAGKYKQTINVSPKGQKSQAVNIVVEVHNIDLPPVTVPVVKLLFAAPLGQPLHFVEA